MNELKKLSKMVSDRYEKLPITTVFHGWLVIWGLGVAAMFVLGFFLVLISGEPSGDGTYVTYGGGVPHRNSAIAMLVSSILMGLSGSFCSFITGAFVAIPLLIASSYEKRNSRG